MARALTAIVLATQNPTRQFCVVDKDASPIAAWNSDQLPIIEPELENLLFCGDDAPAPALIGNVP
ncbi:hypothetical protein BDV59DRAFT_186116 [Aspergillus ambiguus]|uniref:uncharacterized protein n=1 Tax=Aspergillus ambiguus TaxID=176160 RepID=UPI003CCD3DF6